MFWLCGRQAMSVIGLQAALAFSGVYLLADRVRQLGHSLAAATGMVVLSFYPTLIIYEHAVFTEVGTFLFIALLVYFLTRCRMPSLAGAAILCVILSAGYYYRSSLLYLAPLTAVLYLLPALREQASGRWRFERHQWWPLAAMAATIGIAPFVIAYPWQRNPMVSARTGQAVILFGLIKSAVLPPDDPILGPSAPVYQTAIHDSLRPDGKFPAHGLENGSEWPSMGNIYGMGSQAVPIFLRIVRTHPMRYLEGVGRNILLLSGLSGLENDNAITRNRVLSPNGTEIDPGPPWLPPLGPEWKRTTTVSFTSRLLKKLDRYYNWLIVFGCFATVFALVLALLRLDAIVLAFTALPIVYFLIHAAFLMSQDRMGVPAYPLILLNALLLPVWSKRLASRRPKQELRSRELAYARAAR
jgi:hypothetical protein